MRHRRRHRSHAAPAMARHPLQPTSTHFTPLAGSSPPASARARSDLPAWVHSGVFAEWPELFPMSQVCLYPRRGKSVCDQPVDLISLNRAFLDYFLRYGLVLGLEKHSKGRSGSGRSSMRITHLARARLTLANRTILHMRYITAPRRKGLGKPKNFVALPETTRSSLKSSVPLCTMVGLFRSQLGAEIRPAA